MKIKKTLWIMLGCVGLALGAVGAVLPLLPAFPFLLVASISFCKSSEKLNSWFTETRLYKENLEPFLSGKGMTWKTKVRIMMIVTLLMSFGFFMMARKGIWIPCIILTVVWLFHIIYFIFFVKTMKV